MAITQNTYTGNGSTTNYSFTFPYLETTDIKVSVNGVNTTAYTLANPTTVSFNTAPANGAAIRIYRDTDDSALAATFYPGSAIRSQDLNDNFTQNLYVVQEINNNAVQIDGSQTMVGDLDMGGYQINNLAEPTVDDDAATKFYIDQRYGSTTIPAHTRWRKTATAGQTTFSGTGDYGGSLTYSALREQVYLNGALQQRSADYTADNGTSIVFSVPLTVGDVVDVVCVNNTNTSGISNAANLSYSGQFSGQTVRTVAAKLADVVSVKDFGAVGDGVADDTAAIQAAINAATASSIAKEVIFPSADTSDFYKTTAPIVITKPIRLRGESTNGVAILAVGLSNGQFVLDFSNDSSTSYFFGIENLTVRSDNGAPNGIRIRDVSHLDMRNVWCYNLTKGVVITSGTPGASCFANYFYNLTGYQCNQTVSVENFSGGGQYTFEHCNFTGNYGFNLNSSSAINQLGFKGCNFEQCVTNSLIISGTVQGLSLHNCRTEGLDGTADFLIYPTAGNEVTGISISGCYFTTDAGASVPILLGGNGGQVRGFSITGNHVEYAAANNFVTLNGDGESGIIAGNYFNLTTTTPTNTQRAGVTVFSNENASGKCAEYWGTGLFGPFARATFTPGWVGTTVAGNTVPRYSYGRHNRQGDAVSVFILGDYLLNSYTTLPTGQVKITGLPFTSTAAFDQYVSVQAARVDHTMPLVGRIPAGQTYILIEQEDASKFNNNAALNWSAVRDPYGQLSLQFTYFI